MKTHNVVVTVNGIPKSRAQWARELGVTKGAISLRESKGESASSAIENIIGTVHTRKILEHYARARKKHPNFCGRITCLSETGADTHLELCRETLSASERIGDIDVADIIRCELYEALQAHTHGDTAHAVEKCYDAISVLLRAIDVLEGRQKLGKPDPKGESK